MSLLRTFCAAGSTMLVVIALGSCGSKEQKTASPTAPSTPTTVGVLRIQLTVPASIEPGTSVQLVATAVKSDNTVEDISSRAQWFSSNSRVLEVNSSGLAKGVDRGEAVVTARSAPYFATTRTYVLPTGTFKLGGNVTDSGLSLSGVTVTVIDGVGQGLTATTDVNGNYALYGVRDHVRLQAKDDGYLNHVEELDVQDHRSLNFEMKPDHERADLSGAYTVTFHKAACSFNAPQMPETRSYDAIVTQSGAQLSVGLSGADFIVTHGHGNDFSGSADNAGHVKFTIGGDYYYYYYYVPGQYHIVERISNATALVITGTVSATYTPGRISGTLAGAFLLTQGTTPPFSRIQGACYSNNHGFEMVRR